MTVYDADLILLLPDGEPLPAGEEYYFDSLVLMDQLNESVVRDLFASNVGQTITATQIRDGFDQAFGNGTMRSFIPFPLNTVIMRR